MINLTLISNQQMRAPTLKTTVSRHPWPIRRSQFKMKARPGQSTTKTTISSISSQIPRRNLRTAEETTGATVEMAAAEAPIVELTTANPEEATVAVVEEVISTETTRIGEEDTIKGTSSSREEEAGTMETNTVTNSSTPTILIITINSTRRPTKEAMVKEKKDKKKRDSLTSQNRMVPEAEDAVGTMEASSGVEEIRAMAIMKEEVEEAAQPPER